MLAGAGMEEPSTMSMAEPSADTTAPSFTDAELMGDTDEDEI
jgi:hypothetical protein